ncbi:MAG TPA: TetR/AcrR family transcriptional regulator [Acidimicrobiales bacterium]|nr:TetR/AcrR family transcriptional regulator [Acidimicrobiales bacterium]
MAVAEGRGRTNQKARTRRAIVEACVELVRQRQPVTMPEVAKAAMVSEATAYRYFPDLASLLAKALAEDWPTPTEALAPVEASNDPVERVAFATRFLLQGVAERQVVVRSMISATIARPDLSGRARPGLRFGLIERALAPFVDALEAAHAGLPAQLRLDLAVVVSAEALFCLTDLCGLSTEDAIDSAEKTAGTLTAAAFQQIG